MGTYAVTPGFVAEQNARLRADLDRDFESLAQRLARRGQDIEALVQKALGFQVALPSWGVGTGGTRFARFPGVGEPRNILEKLDDCATIQTLTKVTPTVSLHIPWDRPTDPKALRSYARERGLSFDAMNSNTFQDQKGQSASYKFGSLTHTDAAVRKQAIEHNLDCIELGQALGSTALTIWVGDGSNFPGQQHFRRSFERYLDSARQVYSKLPAGFRLFLEHKMFEPAFYSTVINDWGSSYAAASALGPQASCLVDLGHHAPNVNIEMIVARLIQLGKLGGFHLNDSKYGDDDLDAGSIKPYQLFLIFNELVDAAHDKVPSFDPCYMLDQSHNVTDPIESLMTSAEEATRAYVQAHLVDRVALAHHQERNDAVMAQRTLKQAFVTDVSPLLAMARVRAGGAIDPVAIYRQSGYRSHKGEERPASDQAGRSGII